ncbi:MAG: glycine betaine/proline transport system substrate-binding protein [Phenylobacterium sp.]|jgi:glycine betaine/proline transport system substrate-binding protein
MPHINKLKSILLQLLLLSLLLVHPTGLSEAKKNQQPIRVLINDWTSQKVLATITGSIFQSMGYQVNYVFSTSNEQWGALSRGIDHVQIEVWQGTMAQMFDRAVSSGQVVDAGTHQATTREEWWYPLYVEQLCPGLPDWRALKKCAHLFALKEGAPGRYIAGPWEKPEAARIRALELNFKADPVSKADDLWTELKAAQQKHQAIVLFNWTPNWVEAVYEGKFIEFPPYNEACESDPSWGINPQFHHDCGNPKNGWLKKAAWAGMATKWSCAYQTLQQISFDNKTIAQLASWVDFNKMSYQHAATKWLQQNRPIWSQWVPQSCR